MERTPQSDNAGGGPAAASEWLVELLDCPEDALLRARFAAWLAADPAHAADWAEITRTYQAIGKVPARYGALWSPLAAARAGGQPPHRQPRPVRPRRGVGRRFVLGLTAAAVAACLALAVAPNLLLRLAADHATATGETRAIPLPDGSTAWLAPESALDVAFTTGERQVELLEGAAFFEVKPDAARPFRVSARPLQATVLGTAFEVRLEEGAAVVTVRQGRVQVEGPSRAPAAPAVLQAGSWLRLAEDGGDARGVLPVGQVAAWRDGRLIARDRPVAEVVDEIGRYYAGLVVLRGEALARQPLTGVYNLADPLAAFEAVASAQGARVRRLSPWVVVISPD